MFPHIHTHTHSTTLTVTPPAPEFPKPHPQFISWFPLLQVVCLQKAAGDVYSQQPADLLGSPLLNKSYNRAPFPLGPCRHLDVMLKGEGLNRCEEGKRRGGAGECLHGDSARRWGFLLREALWWVTGSHSVWRATGGCWCTGLMQPTQILRSIMFSSQQLPWQNVRTDSGAGMLRQNKLAKELLLCLSPSGSCVFVFLLCQSICLGAQVCVEKTQLTWLPYVLVYVWEL